MDTVLVVEDSRPMQRTLQRLFESDGLSVEIAGDGVAGLESFRKQTPSVVVLDLKLPRMPGKEVCRAFKAHAALVPVVVLSANNEVEDKVLLLELGADDYVTKPFSPKELLARVRRAMRRTGQLAETTNPRLRATSPHDILAFDENSHRLYQHGGDTRHKIPDLYRAGIQATEIFRQFAVASYFPRRIAE